MKIRQNPDLPYQKILDEVIIVAPKDRRVHRLDDVAAHIWLDIEKPRSIDELVRSVSGEFEVDEKTARRDVARFVDALKEKGLAESV